MDCRHKNKHGLTPKQAMAVEHYVLHGCMSGAYRQAYSVANMQPATVNRRAIELFDSPPVAARVQQIREENNRACQLAREEALAILTRIARGKVAPYLEADGSVDVRKVKEFGGPDVEAVEEYVSGKALSRKLKIRDPIRAIERIAHMCGWDKQGPLVADGIIINLNMGGDECPATADEQRTS
jgi:hypothetical protein